MKLSETSKSTVLKTPKKGFLEKMQKGKLFS